jgi:hypothetical protein
LKIAHVHTTYDRALASWVISLLSSFLFLSLFDRVLYDR